MCLNWDALSGDAAVGLLGFDYCHFFDQRRKGYIGEGGAKPGKKVGQVKCPDRLRGQRLPYAIFFGYFLAWRQESNIYPLFKQKKGQR